MSKQIPKMKVFLLISFLHKSHQKTPNEDEVRVLKVFSNKRAAERAAFRFKGDKPFSLGIVEKSVEGANVVAKCETSEDVLVVVHRD